MRCPFCSNEDTQVKDSRPTEDNTAIRRRRVCDACGSRFTTFERIQLRDLVVMKSNGQKENFDRDKMFRSLSLALRKRNIENEKIEKIVNPLKLKNIDRKKFILETLILNMNLEKIIFSKSKINPKINTIFSINFVIIIFYN